jgi:diguanylate cyclase (GGDEF)-like protein
MTTAIAELPQVSILLVDDRRANLLALEATLERLGQRLVRAESGEEALEAVAKERFAVILMDIRMPGLDGFETTAVLKQREESRHTPIIFISGFAESHHVLRSYASGAVDYILKPIDPDALRSKVNVFVRLRQHQLALERAHAELEERVAARTAELAEANAALAREIVERKAAEARLYERAFHDGLTGLANRSLFMIHLNRALARARRRPEARFAILLMDVDRFKVINDTMGHLAGDALLVAFAARLGGCLREIDTAARFGGDEFAALLDGVDELADAVRLAERVQAAVSLPVDIEGKEVTVSASIGVATSQPGHRRAEDVVRDADAAMYRAKAAGRGRVMVFDSDADPPP